MKISYVVNDNNIYNRRACITLLSYGTFCAVESIFIGLYNPKEGENARKVSVYCAIYVVAAIVYAMILSHFELVFV